MNQESKTEKKPKTKSKVQIRDLKPEKDTKGGGGCTSGSNIKVVQL